MVITSLKYRLHSVDISSVRILAKVMDYGTTEDVSHCETDLQEAARKLLAHQDVSVINSKEVDSSLNRAVAIQVNGGILPKPWLDIDE